MSLVQRFEGVRVLCVGDVMLDRFVTGSVRRISPEAPIPVFSKSGQSSAGGGAANVAHNVASLGGICTLIGIVGRDVAGDELELTVGAVAGIEPAFIAVDGRPTTEKTRFVSQGQQILRADAEEAQAIAPPIEDQVLAAIEAAIARHAVLVLSDYAKGLLTDRVIRGAIRAARARGIPVLVDPKSADLARYAGATLVTPNAKEMRLATGIDPTEEAGAVSAAEAALAATDIAAVLITRAERGMTLVVRGGEPLHVPASARAVFDVVGAGDTVLATLALGIGAGASMAEAVEAANAAAGIVVGKRGTATVTRTELVDELTRLSRTGLVSPAVKVLTRSEAKAEAEAWRRDGFKVGFTNGCFDLLHVGHIALIDFARSHCDRLVVGLNTDRSVRQLKGPSRPLNGEDDRALVVAALAMTDAVVLFDEDTPGELIAHLEPDVLVKGADYEIGEIVGADVVMARGGVVLRCPIVAGRSTTSLIAKAGSGEDP